MRRSTEGPLRTRKAYYEISIDGKILTLVYTRPRVPIRQLQTILEESSNLMQGWPVMTNLADGRALQFIDDRTTHIPCKFYRAISVP